MSPSIKRLVEKHFRFISLLLLSLLIVAISLNLGDYDEMLHFRTYALDINGSGNIEEVDIDFDFENDVHGLSTYLPKGEYSMHSTMTYDVLVDNVAYCEGNEKKACRLRLGKPSEIRVIFGGDLAPNGRYQFSFFNNTDISLNVELGDRYSFVGIYSVQPGGLHGQYDPEDKQVLVQTFNPIKRSQSSDYVDFDLYCIDEVSHEKNEETEWMKDFLLVPLVIAFVMLLVSDAIDYGHRYVKRRGRRSG